MKKIFTRIIYVVCISTLLLNILPMISNATSGIGEYVNTIGNSSEGFSEGERAVTQIIGTILNITRIIGAAVAIIMLIFVATKYIIASAGDRADIKKYAINYVVGAMIFLGASAILTVIRDFIIDG